MTWPQDGILLTDKDLRLWQHSSPIAYAGWFFERMRQVLTEAREILAKSANVSVEEVPEWRVRTPLQRAVQLLNRHRDVYFKGDDDRRPVSIIITTLAAWAYQQQRDLEGTLVTLTREMPRYIEQRRGQWWVANPVTPEENFADKWNEKPERRTAFLRWLRKLEEDLGLDRVTKSADARREMLAESFGVQRRGMGWMVKSAMVPTLRSEDVPALADWSHVEQSRWPVHRSYSCRVRARVYRAKGRTAAVAPCRPARTQGLCAAIRGRYERAAPVRDSLAGRQYRSRSRTRSRSPWGLLREQRRSRGSLGNNQVRRDPLGRSFRDQEWSLRGALRAQGREDQGVGPEKAALISGYWDHSRHPACSRPITCGRTPLPRLSRDHEFAAPTGGIRPLDAAPVR